MKKGFTLIELLVVVLIIGILAAIAYPKYERAIEKARFAEGIRLLRALGAANNAYYLANGKYATKMEDLDVNLQGQANGSGYYASKWFSIHLGDGDLVTVSRNPLWHGYRLMFFRNGRIICIHSDPAMSEKEKEMAEYICSSFGKKKESWYYEITPGTN